MVELHCGDCLGILPMLEACSIDAIITDLPYGTTACSWDEVIPFTPMWEQVKRILKPRGAFVTTASQPFTSKLVMSNPAKFRYAWVWNKRMVVGIGNVDKMPLKAHEDIVVFSWGVHTYNPQKTSKASSPFGKHTQTRSVVNGAFGTSFQTGVGYPKTVLEFPRPNNLTDGGYHPTQKPVALYAYLIRTYTNPGDTVLDFCMGSGTTGVAAIKEGRNFVGVERDEHYFAIAQKRIAEAQMQPLLLEVTA